MQIFDHVRIRRFGFLILFLQDRRSGAGIAGEKQQQVVLQVVPGFLGNFQRPGLHLAAGQKIETRQPPVRGDILILLADGLLEPVHLHFARLRGQFGRMHQVPLVGVQRLEQGSGEAARRPQARAGGNVRHRGQFQRLPAQSHQGEGFADDRVLQLGRLRHPFQLGILDDEVRHEGLMQGDINIFINGGGNEKAAVPLVVRRQVGAPAAQGDAQRRSGDDHK